MCGLNSVPTINQISFLCITLHSSALTYFQGSPSSSIRRNSQMYNHKLFTKKDEDFNIKFLKDEALDGMLILETFDRLKGQIKTVLLLPLISEKSN